MADDEGGIPYEAKATVTCHLVSGESFTLEPAYLKGVGEKVVLRVEVDAWNKCCPVSTPGRPAIATEFEIFERDMPEGSEFGAIGHGNDAIRSIIRKRFKTDGEAAGPDLKLRRYVAHGVLGGEMFPHRKQFPFTFSLKRV